MSMSLSIRLALTLPVERSLAYETRESFRACSLPDVAYQSGSRPCSPASRIALSSTALRASAAREPVHRASLAKDGKAPSRGARSASTAPNKTTRFTRGIYPRHDRDSRRDDVSLVDRLSLWR